ncbi:MAG: chaperone modulator CbpM [Flavisolibacter sp.]
MENDQLVSANEFCMSHRISISFIQSLQEYGLAEITTIEESLYIPAEKLTDIEKLVRLHYELNINMEGIDVITRLLNRIEGLQNELKSLENRLGLYEEKGLEFGV